MRITIKDCLALPAFENAQVLSCEDRVVKSIKNISVLEANRLEDLNEYYDEKNQMIVTGFYGIRDDVDAQCKIVEFLAKHGMVSLVLHRVGEIMPSIDNQLIECCSKYGVVLIKLNTNAKLVMSEIIEEVSHTLFYGGVDESYDNSLITNTIMHLLDFEKYSDFESAVKAAAVKNNFQMIILSTDFNPVLTVENQFKTTIERAIRLGRENSIEKRSKVYTLIDVDGVLTYWGPITIQDRNYYMFIVDNNDSYSKDEIVKLADIIQMAIGMWKYTPARDQKAEFVKALKRGNISMAYAIKEETEIVEEHIISVFTGTGFANSDTQSIIDEYCLKNNLSNLQIHEEDYTFGIIIGDSTRAICAKLFEKAKSRNARLFHVTGVDGIEGACDAFKLINETWNQAQQVFPFKRAFSKYDLLLISNCNSIQLRGGFIKRNYMKLLEPFEADVSNKGRQLLDTLETFVLDAGMNGAKTADIMDVHTNTVQYRLKKISELLGAEITANRVIPGLTIALALKRLERA